ncbi:hypothetical protein [Nonomuraea sp. B19D2]|uniref:hypothetical protein n=1 Tax=Nonomuraea sp. B19D2 TaxID=3159561 RepID=UPI0032D9E31E
MTERSYPFDAGAGAGITEDQWSYMASSWQTDGVDSPGPSGDSLKVSTTGQPFTLLVKAGHANLAGFHYELDLDQSVLFEANTAADIRVDRLVLRLNRETNTVALAVKKGAVGSSTPPGIDRSWASPEIPLAYFTLRANSDTVAPADLVDAREFVASGVQMLSPASASTGARQLAEGQIGYDPVAQKFYAQEAATKVEIGKQPDLSPYLTRSDAQSTYSPLGHTHSYMSNSITSGTLTAASPWYFESSGYERIGSLTHIWGAISYSQGTIDELAPDNSVMFTFPYSAGPTRLFRMPIIGQGYSFSPVSSGVYVERSGSTARAITNFFQVRKQTWYYFDVTFISA